MNTQATLYAISDLHIGYEANRRLLEELPWAPNDWLIVAGDVGEAIEHLETALAILVPKFARVIWVPGNHDLWSSPRDGRHLWGPAKYDALVERCRRWGVLTPEDSYVEWMGDGQSHVLVPMFLLYDYTFRPPQVDRERAINWAMEDGTLCADEAYLRPDPYPSKEAWCHHRCDYTEGRLAAIPRSHRLILINHYPLRAELVYLPRCPRLSIWCGTTRTENWHTRFNVATVIYGHLHTRRRDRIGGVDFAEVSLGYPQQRALSPRHPPLLRVLESSVDGTGRSERR